MRQFAFIICLILACLGLTMPARAEIAVTPHVDVLEEYDSNITYTSDNELSDWITRAQVGVEVLYEGKLDTLKFRADVFRRFYNKHSDFDNTSETLSLEVNHELDRYNRLNVNDRFTHASEPSSFDDQFGMYNGRYTYTKNDFNAAYTHDFSSQLSGITRYGNEIYSYSREDLSDSVTNYIGEGLEYALSSRTIALADYRLTRIDYSPGGNAYTNTLTAGVRQYLSSQLNIQAVAGLDFLRTVNHENETNPVVEITLTDDMTQQLQGKIIYLWQNTTSTYNTDVFDNQKITVSLVDQVSQRLRVDLSAFYGEGEYEIAKTEEKLKGVGFGLAYDLFPHVVLTSNYSFTRKDSNVATSDYDRQYVSAGVRIEF